LKNNSKPGIERLYKNLKTPENTPKITQKQLSTGIKRIANTKIQATWGPGFYIQLDRGEIRIPATRQLCH